MCVIFVGAGTLSDNKTPTWYFLAIWSVDDQPIYIENMSSEDWDSFLTVTDHKKQSMMHTVFVY